MQIKRTYKNPQTARMALQDRLNRIGRKLANVRYEIKRQKQGRAFRYYPVVHHSSGRRIVPKLEAMGIICTH